ncbi:MAG: ABC transporter ATP-binding protein [Planctomycetes bacterium]|nr:ABC transporter ATP-binding protein [Planctomycetota bacterium]
MLQADSIQKRFPTRNGELVILTGASLTLQPGESAAIMGPSGSGKSTLLNILGTLEPPSGGTLRLNGCDPFALSDKQLARFRNRSIGFVFQEHHLLPQCSVLENVLLPALADADGPDRLPRARDLLDRLGLTERSDHRPAELSGGERQRAAIARAFINQPVALLADEPTGNLDRATAEKVAQLLIGMQKEENVILVVATHSQRLAACADRCFELTEGRLEPYAPNG